MKVLCRGWKVDWYYVGLYCNIRGKIGVVRCLEVGDFCQILMNDGTRQLGGRYQPTRMVTVVALWIDVANAGPY